MTQPDMLSGEWVEKGVLTRIPAHWRSPLAYVAVLWLALIAATAREWGEMLHQWWNIDTYNHILLIPAVVIWLVWLRKDELVELTPRAWLPGLGVLVLALAVWLGGRLAGINLFAHIGAVGALQAALLTLLGPRAIAVLLLPVGMMCFLVPFGDEIIPFLQMITADISIYLTRLSGVPAGIEGIYIYTPVGLFIVAEECSGVKFLVAMITLGILVAFSSFTSWKRRAIFLAACVIVPIIANGIRAWGTIYIAQFAGVEFAEGFDHIFYGWIFFAIVVAMILGGAWRYFERDVEEAGYTVADTRGWNWLNRAESKEAGNAAVALIGGLALTLTIAITAIYAGEPVG